MQRSITVNIAIIAGAIAAFTIPIMNTLIIQNKPVAYYSLFLLFVTICYAVHHLSETISKEVNELSRQHETYNQLIDENIDRINSVFETSDINKLVQFDSNDIKKRLDTLKIEKKPDNSLYHLRTLLYLSLVSLFISFINFLNLQGY
jgi:hypothetical protein